jgi:HEPN domain-containing protein
MLHEAKIKETQAWLEKAVQDLHSAKWLLSSPDALYNAVGFHCQQAAEKTLKAFLTWQDEPFEKTHSLVALVGKCLSFDQDFQDLRQAAVTLTPYAVAFRYPGDLPELMLEEAEHAYILAEKVWDFLILKLPRETHPK